MLFHCTLNQTILVLFIYYKRLLRKIPVFKLFQLLSLERMVRVLYIITECRFETMESHVQISCTIGQSQLLSHFPYSQCTELTNHSNMLYYRQLLQAYNTKVQGTISNEDNQEPTNLLQINSESQELHTMSIPWDYNYSRCNVWTIT